jgi:hypothetical protein
MTVREPIPDLAEAMPVKAPGIEALVPHGGPVQAEGGAAAGRRARSPLFVASVLIYATTLLLLLAFPRSVSAWLDDFTPNPVTKILRVGTGAMEQVADRIGVSSAFNSVRQTFLKQIQRD